ncbi:MAG: 50S ribosomal protein L9 [Saprospiraceae bacterium]
MELILLKNLDRVGDKHEIVSVKNGYGRNYLIPKRLGIIANATNLKKLEDLKTKEQAEEDKKISDYQAMAAKIEGKTLKIGVKAGATGKIFGSITNVQISSQLREQFEIDIERKKVELPEEIKEIGTYTAQIHFHASVKASINFELIQE